jgi:hypothetical protein
VAVYFARLPNGLIKIGFSRSPHERLRALTGLGSPAPVLLASIESDGPHQDRTTERRAHWRWEHLRAGDGRESFRPARALLWEVLKVRLREGVAPSEDQGVPTATVHDLLAEWVVAPVVLDPREAA